jgi:hypothetical protein
MDSVQHIPFSPLFATIITFFSMALPANSGPRPLIQFRNNFSQSVGLLGRVISPPQGNYVNTGEHKHRINAYTHTHTHTHTPNIRSLSGIRAHDSRQFMP